MLNKITNKGFHPLHIASMNNQYEFIELLLSEKIKKQYELEENTLDGEKATILHHAAKKGCL